MKKYNKLKILKCDINIPINDLNAWTMYPTYRWIYNKIMLCEYQKIQFAPMPIKPTKYPVIIKPIINLYGMGLNIIKVNNDDEFYDNWYNNNFWMEFLEGEHLSWDLVILNGHINFNVCLMGHPDDKNIGKFNYWESIDSKIPNIILELVSDHFKDYTGCLNVETIGNKIIECHLRMGDIDIFPTLDILKGIIATYKKQKYDWNIKLEKIYFYPVWDNNYGNAVYEYLEQNVATLLENNNYIHNFGIDSSSLANPPNNKRLMWFTCSHKDYADNILQSIYKMLDTLI